jgi:hypothetical protein
MALKPSRTLVSFDWAMKSILRDKANFDVLEGFLTTLLNQEIKVLSLLESETNAQSEQDKFNRVDLLVQDDQGGIIFIEIQHNRDAQYLKHLLYGASKLIVENLQLGESFANVKKVISICILYFLLGEGEDDYVYHGWTEFYGLHSQKPLQLALNPPPGPRRKRQTVSARTFYPEYYLIEVERFQNIIQNGIDEWIYFFKNSEIKDEFRSKNIQQARAKLDVLKMDTEERRLYEKFLIARAAEEDILQTAHADGKAEGEHDKALQIARSLLQEGLSPALICKTTGLSEVEINALSKPGAA